MTTPSTAAGVDVSAERRTVRMPIGTGFQAMGVVALGASLFLDWLGDPEGDATLSGYRSSEVATLLACLALGFVLAFVIATVNGTWPATGSALSLASLAAAVAAVAFTVSYLVKPVGPVGAGDLDPEPGLYVAVAGSAIWLVGAFVGLLEAVGDGTDGPPQTPPNQA
jgi:hypothetical protein